MTKGLQHPSAPDKAMWHALVAAVLLGLVPQAGMAGDHYVRQPGTCTNTMLQTPFTSWANAATNIQWALDAAMASLPAAIHVSNGAYVLDGTINLTNDITLTSVNGRNSTTLDRNLGESSAVFLDHTAAVLDGFTITRTTNASGVFMRNGTVQNCLFTSNWGIDGGGLRLTNFGIVTNCLFIRNTAANQGGGMYIRYATGQVEQCVFYTNTSYSHGGGMYNWSSNNCTFTITGCVFNCNNIAVAGRLGAGAYVAGNAYQNTKVIGCSFSSNSGASSGGGIYAHYIKGIFDCGFSNNTAIESGAGICIGLAVIVSNCVVTQNRMLNHYAQSAGGVMLGSSWLYESTISDNIGAGVVCSATTIRNCVIINNSSAYNGSGVRFYSKDNYNKVYSSTIASNSTTKSGGGVAAHLEGAGGSLENCIIYNNAGGAGNVHSNWYVTTNFIFFTNCCFSPALTDAIAMAKSVNNLTSNPCFKDWARGDYRLGVNSPCINAGVNRSWMTNMIDLGRGIRVRYGTVDMGAYEIVYEGTLYHLR